MTILDQAKNALTSARMLIAGIVIALLLIVVALAKFGLFRMLLHSRWLPAILVAVAVVLLLLIIFVGLPWYRERRFVQRLDSGYRVASEQSPQEFQAKFAAALHRLRNLPQHARGDSTYALPWFLMMGTDGAGKTEAIEAAGIFSALTPAPSEGATQNCDWWVSNSMLVLDTAGRYTIPADLERDRGEWYRLLRLIKHYHGREPLSGAIIALPADWLASQADEKLRADAGMIRERIEEAIQELGVDFPLYMLITKCDFIDGFAEFFSALPRRLLTQAVGWIDDVPAAVSEGRARGRSGFMRLQDGLQMTYQRLMTLGVSVLNGEVAEGLRQPLFCFPEEFRELERRLAVVLEVLTGEDVRYHTPLVRGVLISSARQQGQRYSFLRGQLAIASAPAASETKAPVRYFLRDPFETIMPRDRALATAATSKAAS